MAWNLQPGFSFGGIIGPKSGLLSEDESWMSRALEMAMTGTGKANPNPNVGCVFVKHGVIIGQGTTETYGGKHGERVAAYSAQDTKDLRDSVCYVTLEPCSHHGKQPPCAELLIDLKIKRCVIGMIDPFQDVNGQGIQMLKAAGIEVHVGTLAKEIAAWHFAFMFYQKEKKPLVIGKWAQTADALLSDDKGVSKWITGKEARRYTHHLRQKYDCILVSAATVLADLPSLNARESLTPINRHPIKIILDRGGRLANIDPSVKQTLLEKTFKEGRQIYLGPLSVPWINEHASTVGLQWNGNVDRDLLDLLSTAYKQITQHPLQSIFIEGGPKLLSAFMEADLLDLIFLFQRFSFLGANIHRVNPKSNSDQSSLDDMMRFQLMSCHMLGQDTLTEGLSPQAFDMMQSLVSASFES
ncbi:MAG: bifunctional diaminohydroxyphosphoribosylaminopyrimidine deaminase/5-amino-6-(5-phosphoribosylamino)uracil reductase RibD [Pseudobacteriovorax sp.]|nr:bifunctional diaminohydroxyphosphoribosylaminopyrimidine deaminase/5-amino-6-(5-phosphoribosylamino)uracil reductase RibD [Pseudobacteriovorax sp.]